MRMEKCVIQVIDAVGKNVNGSFKNLTTPINT
jgi:hypothetical protein